jgi:hypothetical protein
VEAKERDFSKWQTSNNKNKIFFIQPNTWWGIWGK